MWLKLQILLLLYSTSAKDRTPGPTSKTKMLQLDKVFKKLVERRKNIP